MSYKNILVLGGSGNLGPAIITELVAAGFNVTVTIRPDSKASFDSKVKVAKTDYSPSSLDDIFKGQDAAVSTFGGAILDKQRDLIDAAAQAGIKRFFPSEFGGATNDPKLREQMPFFKTKHDITEYAQSKGVEWTGIVTGPFFDWGFNVGFLDIDVKNRKAEIWDGGNQKFQTTNLPTIGKTIVNILSKPELAEASKNTYVPIASFTTNQNEVLAIIEEITGSKFQISMKHEEEELAKAREAMKAGNQFAVYDVIKASIFGKSTDADHGKALGGLWNDKLGLPKENVKDTVKQLLSKA